MFKEKIKKLIEEYIGAKDINIEIPPNSELGDFAFPCFEFSKKSQKPAVEIAKDLSEKIKKPSFVKEIRAVGPYVNFFIDYSSISNSILKEIFTNKNDFGKQNIGKNKVIVMDIGSPNIAKPLSIGHLRSMVIGNSLYKIYNFLGYKSVSINHLGDWGTQFGKLIYAYKNWGDAKELKKNPIEHLLSLYVKFHELSKQNPELDDFARDEFQKLEKKDKKSIELWKKFRALSLEEFNKIYKLLKIKFDSYNGEAFYNSRLDETLSVLKKKLKTQISDGALIVDLDNYGMPPFFILKSNNTTSYHLRDLSAALYRLKTYKPEKLLYVVGVDQKLHFEQLFKVLDMMKMNNSKFFHIEFGMFSFKDEKMSTRQGNVIFLEDVLDKSIKLSRKILEEKKSSAKNYDDVSRKIGIGAIIFNDLAKDRTSNISFDWNKILAFDGDTGPYLQYTYVRCKSILEKAKKEKNIIADTKVSYDKLEKKEEFTIIKRLNEFKEIIIRAKDENKPNIIANYIIDLAHDFNEFYNNCKVMVDDSKTMKARILLVYCVAQVIKNGLNLLGIETVDKM